MDTDSKMGLRKASEYLGQIPYYPLFIYLLYLFIYISHVLANTATFVVTFRFGRKPTLSVSLVLLLAAVFSIAWCPSIEIYMFLSACVGCFSVGMFMPVFLVGKYMSGRSSVLMRKQYVALTYFSRFTGFVTIKVTMNAQACYSNTIRDSYKVLLLHYRSIFI